MLRERLWYLLGGLLVLMLATGGGAAGAQPGGEGPVNEGFLRSKVARMTVEEKVGQLFVPYVYGESADTANAADVAQNWPAYSSARWTRRVSCQWTSRRPPTRTRSCTPTGMA